jgi:hypothetical protein
MLGLENGLHPGFLSIGEIQQGRQAFELAPTAAVGRLMRRTLGDRGTNNTQKGECEMSASHAGLMF